MTPSEAKVVRSIATHLHPEDLGGLRIMRCDQLPEGDVDEALHSAAADLEALDTLRRAGLLKAMAANVARGARVEPDAAEALLRLTRDDMAIRRLLTDGMAKKPRLIIWDATGKFGVRPGGSRYGLDDQSRAPFVFVVIDGKRMRVDGSPVEAETIEEARAIAEQHATEASNA